jgi:hypothetical protein
MWLDESKSSPTCWRFIFAKCKESVYASRRKLKQRMWH